MPEVEMVVEGHNADFFLGVSRRDSGFSQIGLKFAGRSIFDYDLSRYYYVFFPLRQLAPILQK